MLRLASLLGCFFLILQPMFANGEDLKNNPLRKSIEDKHVLGTDFWIYNDLAKARERAKSLNRPLFVTFRCVPCKDCEAFDASVASGSEIIEKFAQENFVPVRQVEMKGVDLTQFQFDHDLNWAAMFINADGTVYARYGTQSAAGADAYNSIEGLVTTMKRVLELHKNYPANAAELKEKRAKAKPYKTALEMPGLLDKGRYKGETTRRNCIHCHNIHDAENQHATATGKFTQDLLWRYPLPDQIGLMIDGKDGIRVSNVVPDSPADKAGFQAGESITHIDGQVMTSIADMQWALHPLENKNTSVTVTGSKSGKKTLALKQGWKVYDVSWRGSMYSISPKLRVWAPPLTEQERKQRGLSTDDAALQVKWINTGSLGGRAARAAGLRQNDVIVELEGKAFDMTPPQFNTHIKLNYKVGDTLPLTVLRNGKRIPVGIKLVE